jgi:hypothetical protein
MSEDEYLAWLGTTWGAERLATIAEPRGKRRGERLYTDVSVAALAEAYARLPGAPAVRESLAEVLTNVLRPRIPGGRPRVGIYFRDWPIPCTDKPAFAPEERGDARVPPDIMARSIDRAFARGGGRYRTLHGGFDAAHAVARHLGWEVECGVEGFVRGAVVGDLVKIQALFRGANGTPFEAALSKSSCHSWGMYEFAGTAFAEELDLLGLSLVFGYGSPVLWGRALTELQKRKWRVVVASSPDAAQEASSAPDRRRFILLPHPRARGSALKRAVEAFTGEVRRSGGASDPHLAVPQAARANAHEPVAPDVFYAAIEAWLERGLGGWEVPPHDRKQFRSFRPVGRLSGAIYGRTHDRRKLVFHCRNRERWIGNVSGYRVEPGEGRRVEVFIPDDRNLSSLDELLKDWE